MPDTRNRRDDEFAKYDAMSTEELQQLLREDASKPVGEESDTDVLFYVMEVLAKRRKERNEGKSPEEALESFKKHYNTENEISSDSERVLVAPKRSGIGRWMKGLIAAAAVFAFVIGGSLTANAMGFDLWEVIAKWTQETFHFGYTSNVVESNSPEKEDTQAYTGLQEALCKSGIVKPLVPTCIPDGYVEVEIKVEDTPLQRRFFAKFQNGENILHIRVADFLDRAPAQVEQSDSLLEVYIASDINYYIFNNNDQMQVMWVVDNYECCISGPLTISDIKSMIDSIEKG